MAVRLALRFTHKGRCSLSPARDPHLEEHGSIRRLSRLTRLTRLSPSPACWCSLDMSQYLGRKRPDRLRLKLRRRPSARKNRKAPASGPCCRSGARRFWGSWDSLSCSECQKYLTPPDLSVAWSASMAG